MTGAGRGIGRAIALALLGEGARVALLARTESSLRELASAWRGEEGAARGGGGGGGARAATGEAVPITCDVTDPASVRAAVAASAERIGAPGILVNGAGDAVSAPLHRTDDALWSQLLAVNLTGTFLVTREVAPLMIARGGGRIVNLASVAGVTGAPYVSAYTAAKHGVVGLTRALAQELAKSAITVNAVCPGYVDTSLTERSVANIVEKTGMTPEEARAALASRSPQKRIMTAEEIAALVVYLVSEEARGVNGQAIVLDGGGFVG